MDSELVGNMKLWVTILILVSGVACADDYVIGSWSELTTEASGAIDRIIKKVVAGPTETDPFYSTTVLRWLMASPGTNVFGEVDDTSPLGTSDGVVRENKGFPVYIPPVANVPPAYFFSMEARTNFLEVTNDTSSPELFNFKSGTSDVPFAVGMFICSTGSVDCFLFSRMSGPAIGYQYWLDAASGGFFPTMNIGNGASYYIGRSAGRNTVGLLSFGWYAVMYVYEGNKANSSCKIYVNGLRGDSANSSSGTYTGQTISVSNVLVGMRYETSYQFGGQIANLCVITQALGNVFTDAQAEQWFTYWGTNYGADFSLGNMTLWSNAGYENAFEIAPCGMDTSPGGFGGNPALGSGWAIITNGMAYFDGSTRIPVRTCQTTAPTAGSNFWVSCWVNPQKTNTTASAGILELGPGNFTGGDGNGYFRVYLSITNQPAIWFRDDTGSQTIYATATNVLISNVWYNVVAGWDGDNIGYLYVDGVLAACTTNASFGTLTVASRRQWGRLYYSGSNYLNGYLDECRIWKGIDVSSYIADLYDTRRGKFGK